MGIKDFQNTIACVLPFQLGSPYAISVSKVHFAFKNGQQMASITIANMHEYYT